MGIPNVMFARGGIVVPVSRGGGPVGVTVATVGSVEDDPVEIEFGWVVGVVAAGVGPGGVGTGGGSGV